MVAAETAARPEGAGRRAARLLAHDPEALRRLLQRRRQPAALVHPALALRARRRSPCSTSVRARAGTTATCASTRRSRTRLLPSWTTHRTRRSSSTTTTSTSRRASCARRGPTRLLAHFVHIPWPSPTGGGAAGRGARGRCTTACSRTTSSASTRERWRRNFSRAAPTCSARRRSGGPCAASRAHDHVTHHPISVDCDEFDALAASAGRAARQRHASSRAPRAARRPRRPHRSVEEHRARVHALRAAARAASGMARRVTMLALLDPSRQASPSTSAYRCRDRAGRSAAVNARHSVRRLRADRRADRRRLPALGRRRTSSTTCCS